MMMLDCMESCNRDLSFFKIAKLSMWHIHITTHTGYLFKDSVYSISLISHV
jgi:hypothetical protein